ncbi:DNA primase [Rhizobiales bacterium GAS113]|nr:DNA primase [Rhizobiales bacterium GAS113]
MRFSPSLLDEIKARLPVSQVVGRRVRLTKAGREWKGLSPFNAEKTPSFFVNDQKQAWFDFSSGKNGNIFDFVIESEGLSFPEAVERLAAEAGVPLPARSIDAERQEKKRAGLVEVMEMATSYFEAVFKGSLGRTARDYLTGRGLAEAMRAEFRVGYAPAERHGLRDHLAGKGVDLEVMVEAGLLVSGPDIPVAYDRFRNRVMFPIQDGRGRAIAFGGRTLDPEVSAKYLNSPETSLFHKGSLLFNQHRARKAAHDKGRVVAVEGYMDAIAMSAAGFAETVAPLGTALTEEQMGLLWRMADEPILCFDGDKAGQRAAFRAIDLALARLEPGKSVRFAFLPEGQDPDDLVRAAGAVAMEQVLAGARPLSDVLWMRETAAGPLDTPERRAAMERRLREAVSHIGDPLARRYYEADIAERLEAIAPSRPQGRFSRSAGGGFGRDQGRGGRDGRSSGGSGSWGGPESRFRLPLAPSPMLASASTYSGVGSGLAQEALIVLGLDARRDLLVELAEELASLAFSDPDARSLARCLLDDHAFEDEREGTAASPSVPEFEALRTRLRRKLRPGDGRFLQPHHVAAELEAELRQAISLHDLSRALRSELRDAEQALGAEATEANLAWLSDVHGRLALLQHLPASADTQGSGGRSLEQAIAEAPVRKQLR